MALRIAFFQTPCLLGVCIRSAPSCARSACVTTSLPTLPSVNANAGQLGCQCLRHSQPLPKRRQHPACSDSTASRRHHVSPPPEPRLPQSMTSLRRGRKAAPRRGQRSCRSMSRCLSGPDRGRGLEGPLARSETFLTTHMPVLLQRTGV